MTDGAELAKVCSLPGSGGGFAATITEFGAVTTGPANIPAENPIQVVGATTDMPHGFEVLCAKEHLPSLPDWSS